MMQVRGDLNLRHESFRSEDRAELRVEHLEGDVPVVPQVAREIDDGHAPSADATLDRVLALEGSVELVGRVHTRDIGENGWKA